MGEVYECVKFKIEMVGKEIPDDIRVRSLKKMV